MNFPLRHRRPSRPVILVLAVLLGGSWVAPLAAAPGDAERGEATYARRCVWCHGGDGDGLGPAAERLNPPPRDFTASEYKIKTTAFDEFAPHDDDLFRVIRDGMPGTAMPGWGDVLAEREMWDLVAYIKTFADLDKEAPAGKIDYGTRIASSPESIAIGRRLFHQDDRCSECHGQEGKGDAIKKLKSDGGARTWPRNLTKPWTFRASNRPTDVFARVSVGIPGTQMPSFADPVGKKKLSVEERWHVANYVESLAKTREVVRSEDTVVKADGVEGDIADLPDDPMWRERDPTTFFLVPQIIAGERLFTPSNDTITVRALYNDREIAFLLEWDDRTRSIPGDPEAEKIAEDELSEDEVGIQLPLTIPEAMEKPYFGMGDAANPVELWHWSSGTSDRPERVRLLVARGFGKIEERASDEVGLGVKGSYRNGTWRVVIRRKLSTAAPDRNIQFVEGRFIPIAFAAWDGSNGERGSRHTLTTWYWVLLRRPPGVLPVVAALAVVGLIGLGQALWVRGAAARRPAAEAA